MLLFLVLARPSLRYLVFQSGLLKPEYQSSEGSDSCGVVRRRFDLAT